MMDAKILCDTHPALGEHRISSYNEPYTGREAHAALTHSALFWAGWVEAAFVFRLAVFNFAK